MPEDRARELVANAHQRWAGYDPAGLTSHVLRSLLWDIDHPAPEDQTPAVYGAWLDEVEPRESDGELLYPDFVFDLKNRCQVIHGQH
jgi:hypothetical protein